MKLLELLPRYYQGCAPVESLQEAVGDQVDLAKAAKEAFFAQCTLQTATWGLPLWEEAYGLERGENKTPEERRARVMARMRGAGTTTVEHIRQVAGSFANQGVEVQELPAQYRFLLRFQEQEAQPVSKAALRAAVDECRPAHLAWDLESILERALAPATCRAAAVCAGVNITRLPPISWEHRANHILRAGARAQNISQTVLPALGGEREEETA